MNIEKLNLQLCEINRLISYDRSKTLLEQRETVVTNYDKDWDYKKVGNEYFAKRKNSNNWIKVTGKSLEAIKANVFKEKQQDYSQLQPISKSNSQIDGNLSDQPRSDRTGSATRYNVAAKGIEQAGGLDQWLQNVQKSNDYRDQTTYKGNSKPKEPTIYSPKEGQYLDAQGNLKSPNAYWKLPYESNRFQWMTKNKKLPSPTKNNDYKEILLSIYKEDLKDWDNREQPWERDIKNTDIHDVLETAELVTGLLGMIPYPPVALVGNLASMGFGVVNSAVYAYEGKTYDASIALAFALLPGPEVASAAKQLKNAKNAVNAGEATLKAGQTITDDVVETLNKGVRLGWKDFFSKNIKNIYETKGLGTTLKYFALLYSKVPKFAKGGAKFWINIAGLPVSADVLYYLYTLSLKGENQLNAQEQRDKSDFKFIIDLFKNPLVLVELLTNMVISNLTEEEIKDIDQITEVELTQFEPNPTVDKEALRERIRQKQKSKPEETSDSGGEVTPN